MRLTEGRWKVDFFQGSFVGLMLETHPINVKHMGRFQSIFTHLESFGRRGIEIHIHVLILVFSFCHHFVGTYSFGAD